MPLSRARCRGRAAYVDRPPLSSLETRPSRSRTSLRTIAPASRGASLADFRVERSPRAWTIRAPSLSRPRSF